jgi:hypothetical protein
MSPFGKAIHATDLGKLRLDVAGQQWGVYLLCPWTGALQPEWSLGLVAWAIKANSLSEPWL